MVFRLFGLDFGYFSGWVCVLGCCRFRLGLYVYGLVLVDVWVVSGLDAYCGCVVL